MNPKNECEQVRVCPEPLDMTLRDIRTTLYNLRKQALLNPTEQSIRELKTYTRKIKEVLDL
jgi:hypothetical protein